MESPAKRRALPDDITVRVLQIHKDFEPLRGGGGTARHIHGLSRALADRGAEVRVVSLDAEPIKTPYRSAKVSATGLGPHVGWADIVHVHGARSKYAVAGAVMAAMRGKPFFYTPHAFYEPHNPLNALAKTIWDKTAERFLLERGACTILLTEYWRGWLRQRGIGTTRTTIIPNCISEQDLIVPPADVPRLPGSPAILSVGRLDQVKRIDDVIRALARPELAQGHLHVVGKGAERAVLEGLAQELGVADRITFHGFVDDDGVAQMMGGADAFVLASSMEGLPTVLLEALIVGLPVVCSRIPGNLAIMDAAGLDTTYEVGDVERLASLLAAAPGSNVPPQAIEAVRQAFTWERRADEILALYEAADRRAASR